MSAAACGPCCLNPGHDVSHSVKGAIVTYGGVEAYKTGSSKEKFIVYVTDVFGLRLVNHKKVADVLSDAGFTVVIPNLFVEALDPNKPLDFSVFPEWLKSNGVERAISITEAVVAQAIAEGFKVIGATGYCYGAKPVVHLLQTNDKVTLGAISHPSFIAPGDGAKIPKGKSLLLNAAASDSIFKPELRKDFEEGVKAAGVKFQVIDYPDTEHGFAVRATNADKVKAEQVIELASKNTAAFFAAHA